MEDSLIQTTDLLDATSDLTPRIEAAKELASRIVNGQIQSFEEAALSLRFVIAQKLQIGIFDKYFKDLTFDQLVFEAELYRAVLKPTNERTSELINENREELADALFGQWAAEDAAKLESDPVIKNFFETGEFNP
jgi:hypothetical protein